MMVGVARSPRVSRPSDVASPWAGIGACLWHWVLMRPKN